MAGVKTGADLAAEQAAARRIAMPQNPEPRARFAQPCRHILIALGTGGSREGARQKR
jgi:hypothetical protein